MPVSALVVCCSRSALWPSGRVGSVAVVASRSPRLPIPSLHISAHLFTCEEFLAASFAWLFVCGGSSATVRLRRFDREAFSPEKVLVTRNQMSTTFNPRGPCHDGTRDKSLQNNSCGHCAAQIVCRDIFRAQAIKNTGSLRPAGNTEEPKHTKINKTTVYLTTSGGGHELRQEDDGRRQDTTDDFISLLSIRKSLASVAAASRDESVQLFSC
ncbi:hypothetical protein B0H17DRAFT_1130708 [Mycena rosella]|uniref:Uncharacterized protein n=1 Tax=Mycena rosella TaxID=1033263 RepID=A0AAD7DQF5_MYCRO|nr:hypothetical protein B0H17DRAFT_1130708 [Mycena rosella]